MESGWGIARKVRRQTEGGNDDDASWRNTGAPAMLEDMCTKLRDNCSRTRSSRTRTQSSVMALNFSPSRREKDTCRQRLNYSASHESESEREEARRVQADAELGASYERVSSQERKRNATLTDRGRTYGASRKVARRREGGSANGQIGGVTNDD
ncbi:hypothetical protein BD410DRAFT_882645 [Rickenella mellea]|uniref:Uncharacterized protein n=1 Tax=Rickenella mellea TaxID=50990 RepID=A0A4Y7PDF7_9AGAM|nr:hypothetical protein BD410DRAFT_882645 [Rickenella mellea]